MRSNLEIPKKLNFRWRKIVQYSLILSIILIQISIAGFFYNEYVNRQKVQFFEKQLKEVYLVENLTQNSKKDLLKAQEFLQKYIISENKEDFKAYFYFVKKLDSNLNNIGNFKFENSILKKNFTDINRETNSQNKLKNLIDSTIQLNANPDLKLNNGLPKLKEFKLNYTFKIPEIETKIYTDSTAKKGIFGRLKDAVTGKENIRKDSTVVLIKEQKMLADNRQLNREVDSIINLVNNHYLIEIKRIQNNSISQSHKKLENKNNNIEIFGMYRNLLDYGNNLISKYEFAVQNSKKELEKAVANQNSKTNKIRNFLIIGLFALMFLISIFIMYFTRMAFIYEKRLSEANIHIRENLQFKNRILGMLSHELRSPLKIIGIFINRIKKKTEDKDVQSYLRSISFTNNTLLIQANQILEYTKNQQVENKLNLTVFNLKQEINSIFTAIEPYIETRNNKFKIEEDIDPNTTVFSDSAKINQIFINILGNANKFTENGTIQVNCFVIKISPKQISFHTSIVDTGVGISESDLNEIFQPYYQGIISDEVENLGAGLGLSLCKEIVELYEGNISVESKMGIGTTVTFDLKLNIANDGNR